MLFSKSMLGAMDDRYKKYGQLYAMYMFSIPQLVVADPDMIKDILVRDWHIFADRVHGRRTGDNITDNFMTNLSGNDWKRMRSVMSPTFTSGKMKSMFHIMNDCCKLMANNIRDKIGTAESGAMYELNVRHLSGCYSMDVIAKCCFATDTNSFNDPNQVFVTNARRFFNITKTKLFFAVLLMICPMFIKKLFGFKGMDKQGTQFFVDVSKAMIKQRREDGHSNGQYRDYLQLLIDTSKYGSKETNSNVEDKVPDHESHHGYEDGNEKANQTQVSDYSKRPLTDDEIIASSVLFLAVGYDTTGSLITMTTYSLACNSDVQDRLFNELKTAYESNCNSFNYETISGLKYLDAVISETLRILPPAPAIERRAMEEYTFKKNGIKIPYGGSIILPIWVIHHDPNYWPEPDKFDPERFLPENRDKIVPYSYVPFGGGPRNCVGMRFALLEAKLAIANLILNFKFIPCPNTDIPLDLSPTIVLMSPKRVIVGVKERREFCT